MSLYVVYKRGEGSTEYSVECHLGAGRLTRVAALLATDRLLAIAADGDELTAIINDTTNIPWSTSAVNRWHGDFASFIYHNLIL